MFLNRLRLAVLAFLISAAPALAAVVWNGNASWWGQVPPPNPFFANSWLNTATSTDSPLQTIYDGSSWNVVGTCVTGCTGTYSVATGQPTIASATTTNIGAAGTNLIEVVTGTTTITGFGTPVAGVTDRILVFSGALTLTYGATAIILPKDGNILTQIGDVAHFRWVSGSLWRLISYQTGPLFP